MNFHKVGEMETGKLLESLLAQPELWNKNPCRLSERGPHRETQDIFIRYKDETPNIESGDWSDFSSPHFAEWYKTAEYLPEAKRLSRMLMSGAQGDILGGVFIYKVEPGKQIYPHTDRGWHPEFFQKFNICLQSNPKAAFCYDNDCMIQKAGDVHLFMNDRSHWVINEGDSDHIVMTVCMRLDNGYRVPWSPEGWTMDKSKGRV